MPLEKKELPKPSLRLVLNPASDEEYTHFENAREAPFEPGTSDFSRVNAWWLSDASLLSYWEETTAKLRFEKAGLASELIENQKSSTQCYVASAGAFAIVAFRGTEGGTLQDLITDVRFDRTDWDGQPEEGVHSGFRSALDSVWDKLVAVKELKGRGVWFTGHSLGAALATLAGDRFRRSREALGLGELRGIYTFGSPLVGNRAFVDGFNRRCGDRSYRFVNDRDAVTRVPPPIFGYRHVNTERFIGFDDPDVTLFMEPLIDHTPRRYAVLAWNTFVESTGS